MLQQGEKETVFTGSTMKWVEMLEWTPELWVSEWTEWNLILTDAGHELQKGPDSVHTTRPKDSLSNMS